MRGFALYRRQLDARLLQSVQSLADRAAKTARGLTPYGDGRDGGHLRDCIFTRCQAQAGLYTGDIIAHNPHAVYVELGTCRMAAHPYLRPALRGHAAAFLHELRR